MALIPEINIAVLGLILLFVQSGIAIKCYQCNSKKDQDCDLDKLPERLITDCTDGPDGAKYTMCRKIVQHIDFEVNGNKPDRRVIRSCAWEDSNYKGKCYQRSGFGGRQEVCSCLEDNCNSAYGIRTSVLSVMSVTVVIVIFTKLIY